MTSLAIINRGGIFAGTESGGVFRSTDNGNNWIQINEGLKANHVRSFASNSDGYIFAGTWGSSVFRSTNSAIVVPPAAPLPAFPADGAVNQSIRLALSWNSSTDAARYHLQVSTNSTFSTMVVNDSAITATSLQVGPLAYDTMYYWRVRAKNIGGESAWSSVWSFKTTVAAPTAPTLDLPPNGSENHPTTLTLSWNPSTGATAYRLQVSTSSTFITTILDDSTVVTSSRQIGSLANNTTYYWRVKAKNIGGISAWSSVWSFKTTIATPTTPILDLPPNGSENNPTTLELRWNLSTGTTTYRLQVSMNSAFSTTIVDDSTITAIFHQVGPLAHDTTYYWRVRAKNIGGTSAWSSVWSFKTVIEAPSVPILALPLDGSENLDTTLTLNWNPSTGATTYRLQVSTSSTFTTAEILDDSTIVNTSRELGSLAINTTYYWRVNAKNVGGTSAWSSVWSFWTRTTAVSEPRRVIPTEFSLNQNYPNPFNPSTTILYALPKTAFVRLTVINPLGNEVETLVSATQVAGEYEIHWNPKNLASGVYLYRIQAGEFVATRKMVLMR